jgi:hypothetical protein
MLFFCHIRTLSFHRFLLPLLLVDLKDLLHVQLVSHKGTLPAVSRSLAVVGNLGCRVFDAAHWAVGLAYFLRPTDHLYLLKRDHPIWGKGASI